MKAKIQLKLSSSRIKALSNFLISIKLEEDYCKRLRSKNFFHFNKLNEALTHSSANKKINYEKLEFIGDAVLRLIASEFIERCFPNMKVGERSALRSHLVSDRWLAKVGQSIGIQKVIDIGPKTLGDNAAKSTILAEATEALIGALYESLGELDPIHNWLLPFWKKESEEVLADPHKNNYKSALQEWSQGKGLMLPNYKTQEKCQEHGTSKRFFCTVELKNKIISEGWGSSIKEAEKEAAKNALNKLESGNLNFSS